MDVSYKLIFFIVASLLISNVAAMDYLVGDEHGWATNIDYRAWAKNNIFHVGDRLVFKYTAGAHNVVQVKRNGFKNCMANPTSPEPLTSGNDVIELTTPGRKWYISSVGDQCSVGNQKLVITVFPDSRNYFNRKPYFFPAAPAPSPNYGFIWKLFFPPSIAPAPAYNFPWKIFFPPASAPAPTPGYNFPWKIFFPPSAAPAPAPGYDFPWRKIFFPPSVAPAPSSDFRWKYFFPRAPAPSPISVFPWKWMFPPMTNAPAAPAPAPASSPTSDSQEEGDVASNE